MSEIILKVQNLGVNFYGQSVLKNISFEVKKGEVLAIVGPNGAGKSVLLRTLLGLIPHSGSFSWGKNIKVSYVPQKFSVDKDFPLSVYEFLSFKEKDHQKIIAALISTGLGGENHGPEHLEQHILKQRVGWLSGGQLQRVLIAWSLLDNPDVLLFDEPTTGIDVGGEETIYNLLHKMKEQHGLTMLLISHDLNIVYKYASSVLCLNKELICHGTPAEALDSEALKKLYGGGTTLYQHTHGPTHNH